ncbi:serpin family protein [Segniliparus rugosus]|uniref:Serpin domain-containing protein n=1 Tax=Segniliparus rugosus (strain ATCC BAA-974 / DSM 45345 / CCUG 50838 / CIP 108380 / JCM 13579 / CDC 945) TaxID=679197 RepID=U1M2E9_SEGRC|nr:serpin family protein [Segniliparus rugosus]ERG69275.1 hypothetical protein HMPREF9336_04166 [Segniliparus rugosus ATCC BAA-974]
MRRVAALAALALLAGCSSQAGREEPHLAPLYSKLKFAEIGVDEQRDGVGEIAEQSRQLALRELGALAADQSIVFSPWAMARRERIVADANGAGDDPAVAAMIGQLGKWEGDPTGVPNGGVARPPILRSQTILIADRSLDVAAEFLDLLAKDYDMGIYLARPGDAALPDAVSAWAMGTVGTRFNRALHGLGATRGVYAADVTALLAGWQFPFRPELTVEAPFTTADGSRKSVPTMRGAVLARTAAGPSWRAAQLPLSDGVEMRVIVPADPRAPLPDFFMPPARAALAAAQPAPLGIALPRWSAHSELAEAAAQPAPLGLPRIAPGAGLGGWASLAAAAFGEQGVSMAAALPTASTPGAQTAPDAAGPPAIAFAADRPFCFEIFDPGTGLVLLAGRVAAPDR